ncbi:MAG: hypothetical protein P4L99_04105 [Chthoniobacter sp.]|nr:hypothetical protein [Chthoniobacter sp.]
MTNPKDYSKDILELSACISLFFSVSSALSIVLLCTSISSGSPIVPGALSFIIAVIADFFSGKHWVAKLAVTIQILVALTALIALCRFMGAADH